LANLGFYTSPVQKVVRKRHGEIDAETIENYFRRVAMPVIHDKTSLEIGFVWPHHWPVIWELGIAITKVMQNDKSLDKWLLKLPLSVATNGNGFHWMKLLCRLED
jgi:hypothetical protein